MICHKCKIEKNLNFFSKNQIKCKDCQKQYYQQNKEKYYYRALISRTKNPEKYKIKAKYRYEKNKEKRLKVGREWYLKNKANRKQQNKGYRGKNKEKVDLYYKNYRKNNKEILKTRSKSYREKNKEKINSYFKYLYKNDSNYKIYKTIKRRILLAIKEQKAIKNLRTLVLIGCSLEQLKQHLELKFQSNMNWDNHGIHGWHIDHIKPLSSFDLTNEEEQKKAFHYTNLQPLWWQDNLKKSDRY
jgi:hypothetical protein